ncbi:MAG: 23S rRNA (guanosine(2251)-2'-O)-methyltransferase RlmB, partial [Clostridia bacterium]|nr:23S rRNA (guanosine(2251)-2'-O)-methyltransferase RlmB [Clostridia bacterium]
LDDIFASAEQKGQPPLILICDEIEDPHNLGALIRSAECAGFDGVIVPRHRSATLGGVVSKSSAGAVAHIAVVKVANLVDTIGKLKERGVWVYGAELDGVAYDRMDFTGATAIVVGSEGKGIGRLVKKNCDGLVTIPMFGKVNSLNASVAGGILMFAASTQRLRKK